MTFCAIYIYRLLAVLISHLKLHNFFLLSSFYCFFHVFNYHLVITGCCVQLNQPCGTIVEEICLWFNLVAKFLFCYYMLRKFSNITYAILKILDLILNYLKIFTTRKVT